jgi:hypothetical protein
MRELNRREQHFNSIKLVWNAVSGVSSSKLSLISEEQQNQLKEEYAQKSEEELQAIEEEINAELLPFDIIQNQIQQELLLNDNLGKLFYYRIVHNIISSSSR